ncbi:hypothetical protein HK405_004189 [Cladochytrium tenue]|nr:hypothetical protein HK405_004189 [Cladochytrium tenue]
MSPAAAFVASRTSHMPALATATTPAPESLPIVDLALARSDPDAFTAGLRSALVDFGFFYIRGHGVDRGVLNRVLRGARNLALTNTPHYQGWTRLCGENTKGKVDNREQIEFGVDQPALVRVDEETRQVTIDSTDRGDGVLRPDETFWTLLGPNQWPVIEDGDSEDLKAFRPAVEEFMKEIAVAAGLPADAFDSLFETSRPTHRTKVVYYPGTEELNERFADGATDQGVGTVLTRHSLTNKVQLFDDGSWLDVEPLEDTLVVNIGETLAIALNLAVVATTHRVVNVATEHGRVSVPFFYAPRFDSAVRPVMPERLHPDLRRRGTSEVKSEAEEALGETSELYGWDNLKRRLSALKPKFPVAGAMWT